MKFSVAALVLATSALVSCSGPATNIIDPADKVKNYDNTTDYFPDKVKLDTQAYFSVDYHLHYKYVQNKLSKQSFILYQRGTPKPKAHEEKDIFFEVPLGKVATVITTSIPYIEMLGLRERLGLVESEEWITSPCVLELVKEKKIDDFPTEGNSTMRSEIQKKFDSFEANFSDSLQNNKTIIVDGSEAPGVLRRTEWLEFYAAFFNVEKTANEVTNEIFDNYNCVKNNAMANAKDPKPVVAWASYYSYNGSQYFEVSTATYKANLTVDAGASMINFNSIDVPQLKKDDYKWTTAYQNITDIQKVLKDVDVLIDESYIANVTSPNSEQVLKLYGLNKSDTQFKFVKNKAIFREDLTQSKNGGDDWLSNGVVMADAALQDVVNAIHPGFHKDYDFHWMRNVFDDEDVEIVTAKDCKNPSAPLKSFAYTCVAKKHESSSHQLMVPALSFVLTFLAITLAL